MTRWGWIALLLVGCGRDSAPGPSELLFSIYEVDQLTTRFRAEDEERQLDPEQAFAMRKFCPKIERARFEPDPSTQLGTLQVWGQGLKAVWGVVGRGSDGSFGEAKAKIEADGSLRFAVGCTDCEIVLGMTIGGEKLGCKGPGHSLSLRERKLVY